MNLPTEEDVLAALVLWVAAWAQGDVAPATVIPAEIMPYAIARLKTGARRPSFERRLMLAIADSERRLAIERCEREVVAEAERHARIYRAFGDDQTAIGQAVEDLWAARRALEGK